MQKHLILTGAGLGLGLLALAWLRPNTSGGATLVVVLGVLLANTMGAVVWRQAPRPNPKTRKPKKSVTK
jgi:hypothetical protein